MTSTQAPRAYISLLWFRQSSSPQHPYDIHGRQKSVLLHRRSWGGAREFEGIFFPSYASSHPSGHFSWSMACCIECDGGARRHEDATLGGLFIFLSSRSTSYRFTIRTMWRTMSLEDFDVLPYLPTYLTYQQHISLLLSTIPGLSSGQPVVQDPLLIDTLLPLLLLFGLLGLEAAGAETACLSLVYETTVSFFEMISFGLHVVINAPR